MLTLKQWLLHGRVARRWSFGGRVAKYFFGLGLLLAAVQVWASPGVELNAAEREYLQTHGPVSLCIDPDWVPFETLNARGEHEGIAADLLRLAAERGGVQLQLHRTPNWEASLAASKAGACQMLSFLNQSPERDAWLIFTRPLFTDVNVLISREEHPFVVDLSAFAGSSLALPVGTSIEERVRRDYPALRIIHTDSEAQALALVSERKADLTMRSLTVAAYTIKKEGWFNLKIAGQVAGLRQPVAGWGEQGPAAAARYSR